jgi:hypothetical protein
MRTEIYTQDILDVAEGILVKLTDDEIRMIHSGFEMAQEDDPTAIWNLVVENQIYEIVENRKYNSPVKID